MESVNGGAGATIARLRGSPGLFPVGRVGMGLHRGSWRLLTCPVGCGCQAVLSSQGEHCKVLYIQQSGQQILPPWNVFRFFVRSPTLEMLHVANVAKAEASQLIQGPVQHP